MNYAKLINGRPKYAPRRIIWEGMQVFNPAPEKLIALGYKPVQTAPFPAEDPAPGYYWADEWTDDGEKLVQSWTAEELPPEGDLDPAEALDIILGGTES